MPWEWLCVTECSASSFRVRAELELYVGVSANGDQGLVLAKGRVRSVRVEPQAEWLSRALG